MPRLQLIGTVISTAMQKTVKVNVERLKVHPRYKKTMRVDKNYLVHNEKPEVLNGDLVKIEECRPLSRHKSFQLVEIVRPVRRFTDPITGVLHTAFVPKPKFSKTNK